MATDRMGERSERDDRAMTCPFCGAGGCVPGVATVDAVWATRHEVAYCGSCVGYFLEDQPTVEEMRRYYAEEYHRYSAASFQVKRLFRRFRSASQFAFVSARRPFSGCTILEVGAADGVLLNMYKRHNRVVGTEFNDRMREFGRKRYGIELLAMDLFDITDRFDLIVMSHVLEHFTDIARVMAHVASLLRPGGMFFVELPNSPPLNDQPRETVSEYLQTPHIYNFSPTSLTRLFERSGFTIVALERFTYRLPPYLSEQARLRLRRVFLTGSGMTGAVALPTLHYLAASLWKPQTSFGALPRESPWQGLADDIRLIAQRPA
ncbi:MAG: class I SAM-dependent methyltransferase [Candidatus Lambdaproteobacteria bacterium]|nr:class I SAM-dependent methyltransferase [Candidatus Lambdaproteobacteria bacterium]